MLGANEVVVPGFEVVGVGVLGTVEVVKVFEVVVEVDVLKTGAAVDIVEVPDVGADDVDEIDVAVVLVTGIVDVV